MTRLLLSLYALALLAINIRTDMHRSDWVDALNALFPTGAFLLLAVNSWRAKTPEQITSKGWFRAAFWLSILVVVPALVGLAIKDKEPLSRWWTVALGLGVTIGWYGLCTTVACRIARRLNSPAQQTELGKAWQRIVMTIVATGAVAQLSTLFLTVTATETGKGWTVIVGKNPWITAFYSVGTPIFWGEKVWWVTPLFGPTGRAFYVVCIACSVVLLTLLAVKKMRWEDLQRSKVFRAAAAVEVLFCAFVVTDVRWGAEELSFYPVFATVGTVCWAAVILFAILVGRAIAKSDGKMWKGALLVALLLPSVMGLAVIFPLIILVESEGLIVLIAGALLSSTACLTLLAAGKGKDFPAAASAAGK